MGGRGRRSAMLVLPSMRAAEGLSDLCVCVCACVRVRICCTCLGCSSCRCGAIPSGRAWKVRACGTPQRRADDLLPHCMHLLLDV